MKIEIKNRWTGTIIFEGDFESLAPAVKEALKKITSLRDADLCGADLCGANLRGADLRGANLCGASLWGASLCGANVCDASLCGANLRGANLSDADLRDASLCDADLRGASLRGANLRGADLCGANLRGASLRDADLRGANLRGANVCDADLPGANLRGYRDDLWAVVSYSPCEAQGLRDRIADGKIDGSTYTGECACLSGSLEAEAKIHNRIFNSDLRDSSRPIEKFFLAIKIGDKPSKSQFAKLALEWVDQWLELQRRGAECNFGAK
jgi:hypothetical protein